MRAKAVIAYRGDIFQGFQRQNSTPNTVTGRIEEALKALRIFSVVVGSGRTDTGVHATGQVIHFDLPEFWRDMDRLKSRLNMRLDGIRFKHISMVDDSFHARFSAKRRMYRYIFKTKQPSLFEEEFVSCLEIKDTDKLQEALDLFVGRHDFMRFMKSGSEVKDSIRDIYRAFYVRRGDYHYIYFEANGFLRAQVRMMIDFAVRVANSELSIGHLQEQLAGKYSHSRRLAEPNGLYLARVIY